MCTLLVALQTGSAFQKSKLAASVSAAQVHPFGLIDSTWGQTSQGNHILSSPPAPKYIYQIVQNKELNLCIIQLNASLKGLENLHTKE